MKYLKHLAVILIIVMSALAITQVANAAAKTRANLQTDLLNGKETHYNVHTDFANKTTINDSCFNLATDGIDAVTGITASNTEINYLDLDALGTGANTKAVVLDAGEDFIWPATGVLTYGGTGIT